MNVSSVMENGVERLPSSVKLTYTIAGSSEHSGRYIAQNILVDEPQDQTSRWSGASDPSTDQFVLLRLDNLAIIS